MGKHVCLRFVRCRCPPTSVPNIKPEIVESLTYATQIASTILSALGLYPSKLKAVQNEGT
jgi:hypothetical protein